jgi:hypothetical protein
LLGCTTDAKFTNPTDVSGVKVSDANGDVIDFTVSYSEPSSPDTFKDITNPTVTTDSNGVRNVAFGRTIRVKELRITVKSYKSWPGLRIVVYRTCTSQDSSSSNQTVQPTINESDLPVLGGNVTTSAPSVGFADPSFSSKDGWKASENKSGAYVGLEFSEFADISGFKFYECYWRRCQKLHRLLYCAK